MRTGKILWGLILLIIGVLLLLSNFGLITFSWYNVVMWWPLLLIYWGIAAVTHTPEARLAGFLIFLLIAAGLITASVRFHWMQPAGQIGQEQALHEAWRSDVTQATFTLQSGAGEFVVDGSGAATSLVNAETQSPFGQYALTTTYVGTTANAVLSLSSDRLWSGMMMTNLRHRVAVQLNPLPLWTVIVETGASSLNLDLTDLKVTDLTVKSGASSLVAAIGDLVDKATVTVKTGASSVDLTIPASVGAKITTESGLSSRDFPGFAKQTDGTYQTPDFSSASKTVTIVLSAGVSSLSVTRQ